MSENKMQFDPEKIESAEESTRPSAHSRKAAENEPINEPVTAADAAAQADAASETAATVITETAADNEPTAEIAADAKNEPVKAAQPISETADEADGAVDFAAAVKEAKTNETAPSEQKDGGKQKNNSNADPADGKKMGRGKRILKFFIPWKGDPAREILRKAVFLVALVVFIGAFSYLAVYLNDRITYESAKNHTADMVDDSDDTVGADSVLNKYRDVYNANNDFCGWVTVPNTNVDGAVYQTLNNSYYLNHNGEKKSSVYGAYFADYKCTIAPTGNSQNITLYGHHMRDQTMFAQIRKYKDISFYKENPIIYFDSLYETGTYKVFAAFITNADPADDNGYFFDFAVQGFINQEDFLSWIEQVKRRSLINTSVDIVAGDDILTLSTCTYELGTSKDMRFVVMARKVRDGETETVNVSDAAQNANPLYPAAWYKRFGGKKPTFADGLTTWGATSSVAESVIEHVIIPSSSETETWDQSSQVQSIPSFQNPFYSSNFGQSSSSDYNGTNTITPDPWVTSQESFDVPWESSNYNNGNNGPYYNGP